MHTRFSPITPNGTLISPLLSLLSLFNLPSQLPLDELTELLVSKWVTKGHERWQEPEVALSTDEEKGCFWQIVHELPLYRAFMPPTATHYDHLLILGGTLKPQDRKNAHVVRLWEGGYRFDNIAHLGSDRRLDSIMDSHLLYEQRLPGGLPIDGDWHPPTDMPLTEADMMKNLWQRSLLPHSLRRVPTQYISATSSRARRAHTGDNFTSWLDTNPQLRTGQVLVMSISPHVPFQYWEAIRGLRGTGLSVDIAAPGAHDGPQEMKYFTGAIARWLRSYLRANPA